MQIKIILKGIKDQQQQILGRWLLPLGEAIRVQDKLPGREGHVEGWAKTCTVWRRKGMEVGGWEGGRDGHPAGVGVETEELSFQGNWKVCEWDTFRGEGVNFRNEYSSLTPLLRYSGHASEKWITFTLVASVCSNTTPGQDGPCRALV